MMKIKTWTILAVISGIMLIILGFVTYSETFFETEYADIVKNLSRTETLTALRNMFDREYNFTELYQWEHEKVTFVEKRDFAPSSDPLEILEIGKGRCGEFSELYVALCLAHGYQSRLVISVDVTYRVVLFPQHEWAEVKLGDTWVHVDPSDQVWNQTAHYRGWWNGPCIRIYAFEEGEMTDITEHYEIDPQVTASSIVLFIAFLILIVAFYGALEFFLIPRVTARVALASRDELQREDDVLLQAVAFSQSLLLFLVSQTVQDYGEKYLLIGLIASFAVAFYALRALAKIKDSPKCRYYSMYVLAFVVGVSFVALGVSIMDQFMPLKTVPFFPHLLLLLTFLSTVGKTAREIIRNAFKKRYGYGEIDP